MGLRNWIKRLERQTERKCLQCGRKLDPENSPVINVGGQRYPQVQS
jgi:hypothetical protein